ncbi:MAG: CAP domain-containing protein [Xanthomonadales bacterium]|nr:CAP domain-containing protein [Xanthomonadales bacterium]
MLFLLLLLPLSAHAAFLDCIFFNGYENPGTTNTAALGALEVHNCARKTVVPAATTAIPPLVWSTTVAAQAQTWANHCTYQHGGLGTTDYGQNLYAYANTDQSIVPTLTDAALVWAGEEPDYNYTTNSCAADKACGHYTQMVWAATTHLGCGQAVCTQNNPFDPTGAIYPTWHLFVCDYDPRGNFIGNRPY